jgi:hypothetical protein
MAAAASLAHADCGVAGRAITLAPAAPGVWWVPAHRGEANAGNRGQVSNLLVVRDGHRLWLVGSGPSPAFGRALDCRVQAVAGRGHRCREPLGPARSCSVRAPSRGPVTGRMPMSRRRCAGGVPMRAALARAAGAAAVDPARGRCACRVARGGAWAGWGRSDWWLVMRATGVPVTLWHVRGTPVLSAHGLLWADALPELRGSDVKHISAATLRRAEIAAAATAPQLIGEQGPSAGLAQADAHLHYWRELARAITAAQTAGADGTQAQALPGIEPALLRSPVHALNWQRAWRQAEDAAFAPADAADQGRGRFQRNLR